MIRKYYYLCLYCLIITMPLKAMPSTKIKNDSCVNFINNLEQCNTHLCKSNLGIIFYTLGYKKNNKCSYIQISKEKEFMHCNLSKNNISTVKKYVWELLNSKAIKPNGNLVKEVVELFKKNCSFFKKNKLNKKIDIESRIINELDYQEDYVENIQSLFFSKSEISFLSSIFKENDKSDILYLASVNKSTISISNRVSLDSIIYMSPSTWKVWVNGNPFQSDGNLKIEKVTKEKVTFSYKDNNINKELLHKILFDQRIYIDNKNNIYFTLGVNQAFHRETLLIK